MFSNETNLTETFEISGTLDATLPLEVSLTSTEEAVVTDAPSISLSPTYGPTTEFPTYLPSTSLEPSYYGPSSAPSNLPTNIPSTSAQPSYSGMPTYNPSFSSAPSALPSQVPSLSVWPTLAPSSAPSSAPTAEERPFGVTFTITDNDLFSDPPPSIEYEFEL